MIVSRDAAHEDAFVSRYRTLLAHAVKLTRGNRDLADDLLQDAFVQFTGAKPDLRQIENLDAYLFSMVKYLHLAHVRRGMRDPLGELAVVDYESAELSLSSAPASTVSLVCEQLVHICEFAFSKKDESRAHALFLLRFVHGYYIDELAALTRNSKPTIRKWLQEAQSEVRLALSAPQAAAVEQRFAWMERIQVSARRKDFLQALREHLLSFGRRHCPSRRVLQQIYSGAEYGEVSTELLGHYAVCRTCLDRANDLLGLPLLAERHDAEVDGRGRRNGPGSGGAGTERAFDLRRARRRVEAIEHHEPHKLLIRIDGIERAEQDLTLPSNRFALKLAADEKVHLIEIVSEQGVCLLSFFVPEIEPGEPLELRRELHMSGERIVAATVRYGETWPAIEVSYQDPESAAPESIAAWPAAASAPARPSGWRALWQKVRTWIVDAHDSLVPRMNPLFAAATILGVVSIALFLLWWSSIPRMSANVLLLRAEATEAGAVSGKSPGVIYQKVSIRTQRRTVERTIYRDAQGVRRPRRQQLSREDELLRSTLASAGINWDAPLSASDYAAWRRGSGTTRDEVTRSGVHLLTLTTTPLSKSAVVKETLTIRDTDFHTVDRTIVLRDSGTVEIAELNYDVLPWGAVNQDWFEPLVGGAAIPGRLHPSLAAHLPHLLSAAELDEAELSALLVLNRLHADQGEQIEVTRNGDGIQVRGLVESEQRKEEIESQLVRLHHVTPLVFTFDEMARGRTTADGITSIRTASVVRQLSPLEIYLVPQGQTREQAAQLAQDLVLAAASADRESKEIADLLEHFSAGSDLTPQARTALTVLIANHRGNVEAALEHEESLLHGIGFTRPGGDDGEQPAPIRAGLLSSAAQNLALCREVASTDGQARPVEATVPELLAAIARLHSITSSLSTAPDLPNAAGDRPFISKKQ
nr:sigma factor [Paracidobacterium acidisoli]